MRDVAEPVANGRLRISFDRGVAVHILRLWRPKAAVLKRLAKALGAPLPTRPNATSGDTPRLLWMGPEEWALIGADAGVAQRVAEACGEDLHHLSDVSDGRIVVTIAGTAATELLSKGCSLDFHQRTFAPATCARSLFAQLPVLIERPGDEPAFRLIFDRTQFAHLDAWLNIASAEFLDPAA